MINVFQNNLKIKYPIYLKKIVEIIKFIETNIYLMEVKQIIIINPKYTFYIEKQTEEKITIIDQINYTTTCIFICYKIKIKIRIIYCYCKHVIIIKETVYLKRKNQFLQLVFIKKLFVDIGFSYLASI